MKHDSFQDRMKHMGPHSFWCFVKSKAQK